MAAHLPPPSSTTDGSLAGFDTRSGSLAERALFNHRTLVMLLCALVTAVLGWQATHLKLNASFEKMIPTGHPFIVNYLANRDNLKGLGNEIRIAVVAKGVDGKPGSIYDPAYLKVLQQINDAVFLIPGVERPYMKSLWTPSTRWAGVTEVGLEGGPVMPDGFSGTPEQIEQLRGNVARSGEIGQLVAADGASSIVRVPLLAQDSKTGNALDYALLSERLDAVRAQYAGQTGGIHITGFAKIVGDLIAGLRHILLFFGLAIAITVAILFAYTRCVTSTALVVVCSLVAVVWQLGLLPLLGYELDPYSVLVPFLVFAIGMSHGAQKMNGITQDIGRGMHRLVAARFTFRRLFLAGLTALLCDAVGFGVLTVIDIPVIRDLALIASIGVAVLIVTNLIMLPILLSFVGVSPKAAARSVRDEHAAATEPGGRRRSGRMPRLWRLLAGFTERRRALPTLIASAVLTAAGFAVSLHLKIGDLDPGAPELRPDSTYNVDAAYLRAHYGASSDVFAVMVKTPPGECTNVDTLLRVDTLEWTLSQLEGVEFTHSMARQNRLMSVGLNEGSTKWFDLVNSQAVANSMTDAAPRELFSQACDLLTVYVYLRDHKADTLTHVVETVQQYAQANDSAHAQFLMAAGNAGIEAATNIVVHKANREMLVLVYTAVTLLCLVTFRSWRAVLCTVLPLAVTSILCEALMVALGIGVKVATLPVIALGVGIGVDYGLYVMSILLARMKQGDTLAQAYQAALGFTGKVVLLTGVTLAVAVATWAGSPIKFQADMGILLAFMFVWNMVGALVLLPALACYLLPASTVQPARNAGMGAGSKSATQSATAAQPASAKSSAVQPAPQRAVPAATSKASNASNDPSRRIA